MYLLKLTYFLGYEEGYYPRITTFKSLEEIDKYFQENIEEIYEDVTWSGERDDFNIKIYKLDNETSKEKLELLNNLFLEQKNKIKIEKEKTYKKEQEQKILIEKPLYEALKTKYETTNKD